MSLFLASILFIFCIIVYGFLVDLILIGFSNPGKRPFAIIMPSFSKLPLYFALGAALYTFWATLLSINGIKLTLLKFFISVILLMLFNIFLYGPSFWKNRRPDKMLYRISAIKAADWFVIMIVSMIVILCILKMLTQMAFPSFGIDLLGHLLSKAKILLYSTYKDSFFLHDPLFANLHSNYPPMFGIFYNLLFLFVGGALNSCYHIVHIFILFSIGYAIYIFLSQRISKVQAVIWFFIFISAKIYMARLMDGADVFLSLFFLLAACEFYRFLDTGRIYHVLTFAILSAGGVLLKNEGLIFAALAAIMILLYPRQELCKKKFYKAIFLLILAALTVPWLFYRFTLPAPDETHENLLMNFNLVSSLPYLPSTTAAFVKLLFSWFWHGIFILWPAAFVLFFKQKAQSRMLSLSLLAFGQLASYLLIFWACYGKMIQDHIGGIARLMAHCYPIALITVASAAGLFFFKAASDSERIGKV
ncbi:MAG: hypothetical protein ABH914_01925 [Candidatus Omnitrophota bacterium]